MLMPKGDDSKNQDPSILSKTKINPNPKELKPIILKSLCRKAMMTKDNAETRIRYFYILSPKERCKTNPERPTK